MFQWEQVVVVVVVVGVVVVVVVVVVAAAAAAAAAADWHLPAKTLRTDFASFEIWTEYHPNTSHTQYKERNLLGNFWVVALCRVSEDIAVSIFMITL
jgi:opacity protein-like surface antigen